MSSLRARFTGVLAALALGALAMMPGTADDVNAQTTCGPFRKVTFYSEPEKINAVGTCITRCNNNIPSECTGTMTPYYIVNWQFACPFCA